MNFVALVERLRMECGVSGPYITDLQGTLPREIERLKRWTITSWVEIQTRHPDWLFLRTQSSHTIPAHGSTLTPAEFTAGTVQDWHADTFRIGPDSGTFADSEPLPVMDYEAWRIGPGMTLTPEAQPNLLAIREKDQALFVSPQADQQYKLWYDYQRTPQELSGNTDVPICPARFHMIIVYRAMMKYGRYEAAPEVLADGRAEYRRMLGEMQEDQLPVTTVAGGCSESW